MSSFEMATVDDGSVYVSRVLIGQYVTLSVTSVVDIDVDNDNEMTPEQTVTATVDLTRGDILALTRALLAQLQDME